MTGRAQRSLRDELVWNAVAATAFVVASAIVLHAYVPPPTAQPHPRRQVAAIAELLAAAVSEVVCTGDAARLDAWAQRVARSDIVLGIIIIGPNAEVAAVAADKGELAKSLLGLAEQTGPAKVVRRTDLSEPSSGDSSARTWLATAPLHPGRAQVAMSASWLTWGPTSRRPGGCFLWPWRASLRLLWR